MCVPKLSVSLVFWCVVWVAHCILGMACKEISKIGLETVDLKIFIKSIFMVCINHENKNTKYTLEWIIITVSTFRTHGFTINAAS